MSFNSLWTWELVNILHTLNCFRFVFKCWSYKYNVYPRNVNNSSQILLKIMKKFKLCVPATKYYYTFYSSLDIWKTCTLYKVIKTILKVLKLVMHSLVYTILLFWHRDLNKTLHNVLKLFVVYVMPFLGH